MSRLSPINVRLSPKPNSTLGSKLRFGATSATDIWPPSTSWSGLELNPVRTPYVLTTGPWANETRGSSAPRAHKKMILLNIGNLHVVTTRCGERDGLQHSLGPRHAQPAKAPNALRRRRNGPATEVYDGARASRADPPEVHDVSTRLASLARARPVRWPAR